jgi:hypothetical protein
MSFEFMSAKSFRSRGGCVLARAMRRALAAVCFALALPLVAFAQAGFDHSDTEGKGGEGASPQSGVYGFERSVTELGFWGGGSVGGPTLIGTTEETRLGLFAFRYARVLSRGYNLAFKYTLDVPFAQLSYPLTRVVATPSAGSAILRERKNITGAGLSPIGFQVNFRRRAHVQPFVQASGGFLYFGDPVPDSDGARLNFTTDFGGGVEWKKGARRAWTFGYRYHHVSNRYRVGLNPGFDSNLFYAGFSIFR